MRCVSWRSGKCALPGFKSQRYLCCMMCGSWRSGKCKTHTRTKLHTHATLQGLDPREGAASCIKRKVTHTHTHTHTNTHTGSPGRSGSRQREKLHSLRLELQQQLEQQQRQRGLLPPNVARSGGGGSLIAKDPRTHTNGPAGTSGYEASLELILLPLPLPPTFCAHSCSCSNNLL
jgi:hypothetical protein